MRNSRSLLVLVATLPMLVAATLTMLHAAPKKPAKTAQPPKWKDVEDRVFIKNARSKLVGTRPDYQSLAERQPSGGEKPAGTPVAGAAWSKLVSRETLEDEVKSYVSVLAADVSVPAKFSAGGYRKVRRHFTVLATLFAIVAKYDTDVRWKSQAAGLHEMFARAGFNAKAGSAAVYDEAKLRKAELSDLVRGISVTVPGAQANVSWNKVADLAQLMTRFETGFDKRLKVWLASEAEFKSNIDRVKHEAELLAAFGRVIQQDGFEHAEEEEYLKLARQLESAAVALSAAALAGDHAAAQKAAGSITKSCANCHSDYR